MQGAEVVQVCFDFGVTIRMQGGWELRINGDFRITAEGRTDHANAQSERLSEPRALSFLQLVVRDATVRDGTLQIRFSDGSALHVSPPEKFEGWTLSGPDHLLMVSLPGGQLAVWRRGSGASDDAAQ